VGGFGGKRRSGENVPSPSSSPFSSEPSHKLCFSLHSPRTLCIFSQIWQTKSGPNRVSWEEGWQTGVCGRGLGVDKSPPQGACAEEPVDRAIQG